MNKQISVKDIIKKYLRENDFDGLCNDECGCTIDDLIPCTESDVSSCIPGYLIDCSINSDGLECDGTCENHVVGDLDGKDRKNI